MTPPDSETSESNFSKSDAVDFGRHLFSKSKLSPLEKLRIFIFAAADTECPLSFFREVSLASDKDIPNIIEESQASVRNHLIELCCGNMGIVWKDKATRQYRVNTTKPNDSEWRLLVEFRLALETEWIRGMYQDEGGIEILREANKGNGTSPR